MAGGQPGIKPLQEQSRVAFGATANHCAFYLMSGSTVEAHKDDLKDYDTSKGTIRFQADDPLPPALVRKLVKARIAENEKSTQTAGGKEHVEYHKDGSVWAKGMTAKGVPTGYWEWYRKDGTRKNRLTEAPVRNSSTSGCHRG